jgi:RNA polymerase sigma factor (sigma-70 family)
MEDTDEELMLRYKAGDVAAFDILYTRHRAPLYRYFLRLAGPAAVAEELYQDVWLNVIRARGRYEVRARFRTWLYQMAHNRLVDHYRRTAIGQSLLQQDDPDEEAAVESVPASPVEEPENLFARRRLAERLIRLLSELPQAQREAFLLREESGLSLEEIAGVTGVNAETAKSRLRYATARLRRGLATNASEADSGRKEN